MAFPQAHRWNPVSVNLLRPIYPSILQEAKAACNEDRIAYKCLGEVTGISGEGSATLHAPSYEKMSTVDKPDHDGLLQAYVANLMRVGVVLLEGP